MFSSVFFQVAVCECWWFHLLLSSAAVMDWMCCRWIRPSLPNNRECVFYVWEPKAVRNTLFTLCQYRNVLLHWKEPVMTLCVCVCACDIVDNFPNWCCSLTFLSHQRSASGIPLRRWISQGYSDRFEAAVGSTLMLLQILSNIQASFVTLSHKTYY